METGSRWVIDKGVVWGPGSGRRGGGIVGATELFKAFTVVGVTAGARWSNLTGHTVLKGEFCCM